jgi:NADH-quinone oxidoreductase subunit I
MTITELVRRFFLIDLLEGMWVTFRHQNPKDLVTEQYPMQRPEISERFRGQPRLLKDETGKPLCTACGACALACPEKLIKVASLRDPETKKKVLTEFDYDLSRCMFCGLCEEACSSDALTLSPDYELALYTREGMQLDKTQLEQGVQRKVYER